MRTMVFHRDISIAFVISGAIHQRYDFWHAFPAYAISLTVGYLSIECHEHYFNQVLAGAVIGSAIEYLLKTE